MESLLSHIARAFSITWTTIRLFCRNCLRPKSSNPSPTVAQPVQPFTPIHRPHFIPFNAPYLCASSPYDYDPSGFWDFPTRAGWALDPTGYRKYRNEQETMDWEKELAPLDARHGCRRRKAPESLSRERPRDALRLKCYRMSGGDGRYELAEVSEQVAFLQAWLFFGLLAQVSLICGVSVRLEDEFVLSGRQVSTAALDRLMQKWLDAKLDSERVAQIVQAIQHVLSMQTRFEDPRKKESQALTYAECKVLLSIRVAFRSVLLTLALSGVCEPAIIRGLMDPQIQEYYPAYWDELKDFSRDELLREGWCQSECKLLERMDGCYEFFATRLTRPLMNHSKCDDFRCLADQVDERTYNTVHVESECRCTKVIVDQKELQKILKKGMIPRIVISEDYQVSVVDSGPYIAISHVWSHGLGNPSENALPLCQIRRLNQNITQVTRLSGATTRAALWMDTLCIPVDSNLRDYRKQAIVLLRKTYEDAAAVLVLDRELGQLDPDNTPLLEQRLVMSFIGWTRRLWTLQEGALAQGLYFQMLGGPRLMHDMQIHAKTGTDIDQIISKICFREDIEELMGNRIPQMETMQRSSLETSNPTSGLPAIMQASTSYQRLCFAVKNRSTSKMEDEAFILATIIGAETKQFVDMPDIDSRMALFHTLMGEVPSDIIFANIERISNAPFRWAPRSLLNFSTFRINSFGPPGRCDTEGLHATYTGFIPNGHSGSGYEGEDGKFYTEDTDTRMKYIFVHQKESGDITGPFRLPERPAFVFRYFGIDGNVAVAHIVDDVVSDKATDVTIRTTDITPSLSNLRPIYKVTIVGHLKMVSSGGSWDIDGKPSTEPLRGKTTEAEQKWLIT